MKTSPKEKSILMQELIGANMQIVDSTDQNMKNIEGTIIYETKNMFIITDMKTQRIKKIPKRVGVFQITLKNNLKFRIKGSCLLNRPEERLKKIRRSRK